MKGVTQNDPNQFPSTARGVILNAGAGAPWHPNDILVTYDNALTGSPCDPTLLQIRVLTIAGVTINSGWVSVNNTSLFIPGTTPCCSTGYDLTYTGGGFSLVMRCP